MVNGNSERVVGAGRSIQDVLDSSGEGTDVRIAPNYDVSVESLPIRVEHTGVRIRGTRRGPGEGNATVHNDTGRHLFHLNPGNERSPGITLRDLSILQTGGGNGVRVQNSKFNLFENVDVDANRVGSADAWHFGTATDSWANNSQVFVGCSAEQAGQDGFRFGNKTHHVAMFGCTALGCARMGVYVEGPYSFKFLGGQVEDCGEPGFRARQADSVLLGGNTYVEGNAKRARLDTADVAFVDTGNAVLDQAWMNPRSKGTRFAVTFRGACHRGAVRHLQTSPGYDSLVYTECDDTELNRATHTTGPDVDLATVGESAARVRDRGTIVGAGVENGGNGDLSGVDLAAVTGRFPGDVAVSDGTNTTSGLSARWLAAADAWQPSDGGPVVRPRE